MEIAASELRSHLAPLTSSLRGSAMILDLFASAQEWAATSAAISGGSASRPAGEQRPAGAAENRGTEASSQDAERTASVDAPAGGGGAGEGPLLTAESFAELRARMLREAPAPAARPLASPLTGREIWQRRIREGVGPVGEEDAGDAESEAEQEDEDEDGAEGGEAEAD